MSPRFVSRAFSCTSNQQPWQLRLVFAPAPSRCCSAQVRVCCCCKCSKAKTLAEACMWPDAVALAQQGPPPAGGGGAVREAGLTINSGIDRAVNGTTNAVNTVANGEFTVPFLGQRERHPGCLVCFLDCRWRLVLTAACKPPLTNLAVLLCPLACLSSVCMPDCLNACPRHPGRRDDQLRAAKRWQRHTPGCGDNCKR